MLLVQFRRQIVHQVDALPTFGLINQMSLGDAQGADHQLLLPPRQDFRRVVSAQANSQISPLWSSLGMSHLLVTQQAAGQNLVQAAVLVPTAVIAQRQPFQLDELR
ncbi:hypothetical protein D3C80_1936430 [compost metagenome]